LRVSLVILLVSGLLAIAPHALPGFSWVQPVDTLIAQDFASTELPKPQPHPLPLTLAKWRDLNQAGDYFDQIQPVEVGYLVWSKFPITVYVEPISPTDPPGSFHAKRSQVWLDAVLQSMTEWNQYLPLQRIEQQPHADITILRSTPPLRIDRRSGQLLSRARAAETRFELYTQWVAGATGMQAILAHRFTIQLRPDQAAQSTLATARHELGHALGVWGHSPLETDALYFAQVRHPPLISPRDINTLKRIYQQPTRLGWLLRDLP
jgi:predicted Zn-dependent protease